MARGLNQSNPQEERNPTTAEVQAANAAGQAARVQQQQGAQIQVLDASPIREVDMSPPGNRIDMTPDMIDRHMVDPNKVAPIVRSAVDVPLPRMHGTNVVMKGADEKDAPVQRVYRVEKELKFLDRTSGTRTTLHEGKEITDTHYPIRDLQRQGAKLKDITDVDANAPV